MMAINCISLLRYAAWTSSGSAGAPPAKAPPPPHARSAGKTAANPAQTDAALEKAIRDRFARSKIGADGFTVRVQGGVATLEGNTGIIQHKGTATRLARLAGAVQVVNRIEIPEQARLKASANLAKGRRRAQVKRSESGSRSEPRSAR